MEIIGIVSGIAITAYVYKKQKMSELNKENKKTLYDSIIYLRKCSNKFKYQSKKEIKIPDFYTHLCILNLKFHDVKDYNRKYKNKLIENAKDEKYRNKKFLEYFFFFITEINTKYKVFENRNTKDFEDFIKVINYFNLYDHDIYQDIDKYYNKYIKLTEKNIVKRQSKNMYKKIKNIFKKN